MDLKIEVKMKNWKRCKLCEDRQSPCSIDGCIERHEGNMDCSRRCHDYIAWQNMKMNLEQNRFCPKCGRPLTKTAFKEFGDRIVEVIIGREREL